MIFLGALAVEAADCLAPRNTLLQQSLLQRSFELHDLNIIFVPDPGDLLKMRILQDSVCLAEEVIDDEGGLLPSVRDFKHLGPKLLDQREDLGGYGLIVDVDQILSLSLGHVGLRDVRAFAGGGGGA